MLKLIKRSQAVMPYLFAFSLIIATGLLLMELPPSEGGFPHADKIIHTLLFLLLSGTGILAFPKQATLIFVCLAIYAATTELLQHLLTVTRHASLLDWVADIIGILLCLFAMRFYKQHDS